MIKVNKIVIFENKKEWKQNYNKDWRTLCHCLPNPKEEPTSFPVAYEIYIDNDAYSANCIDMISMDEAKQKITKYCEDEIIHFEKIINKVKQI